MESDVCSSAGKVLNIQVVHREKGWKLEKNETATRVKDSFPRRINTELITVVKRSVTQYCWALFWEEAYSDPASRWGILVILHISSSLLVLFLQWRVVKWFNLTLNETIELLDTLQQIYANATSCACLKAVEITMATSDELVAGSRCRSEVRNKRGL